MLMQMLVSPLFGLETSLTQTLITAAIFNGMSLARSYVLRPAFEPNGGESW